MTTPHEPYTERHLALVREAEAEDGRTYCPPLRDYNMRPMGAGSEVRRRAPSTHLAIFKDDAERKDFGAAIMVWACVMGGGILLAYGIHWAWNALTGGV